MISLMQVTFACLIYPALIISYAGQAAFVSRHFGTGDDIVNLSESVPDSKLFILFHMYIWSFHDYFS